MARHRVTTTVPHGAIHPSRRKLIGGTILGAAFAAPMAITRAATGRGSPQRPDGALLHFCAAFDDLETSIRHRNAWTHGRSDDRTMIRLIAEQGEMLDRIVEDPADTFNGVCRKAATLARWAEDILEPSALWDQRLVASIIADLLRLDPGTGPGPIGAVA